jgi:putative transcription antitermination factor YqgF
LKIHRFLALDVGDKYTGYALFECSHPFIVLKGHSVVLKGTVKGSMQVALNSIVKLIGDNGILTCVVGIPFSLQDGGLTAQGEKILHFCKRLSKRYSAEIFIVDESFSTIEVESQALSSTKVDVRKVKKSGQVDSASAVLIGERYIKGPPEWHIYPLSRFL